MLPRNTLRMEMVMGPPSEPMNGRSRRIVERPFRLARTGRSEDSAPKSACYHRAMKKLALPTLLVLGACASMPPSISPDAALDALVEEYFERQLELAPMSATAIGDSRYDDRLDESTTPGFREKELAIERAFLDRVRLIDVSRLSPASRLTHEIFTSERELAIEGQRFPEELMPFHQMGGLPMDLAV